MADGLLTVPVSPQAERVAEPNRKQTRHGAVAFFTAFRLAGLATPANGCGFNLKSPTKPNYEMDVFCRSFR